MDALDRTEQEAHDRSAELIRAAERRAREITGQADQNAALIEEQLTYLTTQLDHVRARVTAIRSRLAHELRAEPTAPLRSVASEPKADPREVQVVVPEYASPASPAPGPPLQLDPGGNENDSLPETLRVLRAALESLNGQPSDNQPQR